MAQIDILSRCLPLGRARGKIQQIFAQIAQSVEQRTENPCVAGSIPALGTKGISSVVERRSPKPDVRGSSPLSPATTKHAYIFLFACFLFFYFECTGKLKPYIVYSIIQTK